MRIEFFGVRGSTPAPGPDFVHFGGHTSCVALSRDEGPPRLVLDAGTGLSSLSRSLAGAPFDGTLLLGHLHWDHTHGLPFFPAGDRPDSRVDVVIPEQGDAEGALARAMSPPSFPITPAELRGRWTFRGIEPGEYELEGFSVLAREIPHKGGRTFGYRVSADGVALAYLSDHNPLVVGPGADGLGAYHGAALELVEGVDVLIHDAQYTAAELADRASFGHSAADYALGLAEAAEVGHLVLFHHDPSRVDDEVTAVRDTLRRRSGIPVDAAREGWALELDPSSVSTP